MRKMATPPAAWITYMLEGKLDRIPNAALCFVNDLLAHEVKITIENYKDNNNNEVYGFLGIPMSSYSIYILHFIIF